MEKDPEQAMRDMVAQQAAKANESRQKAKSAAKAPATPVSSESGSTQVFRTVDAADLKPNPFRTVTEDVVANAEDEGGKFEKRKLEMGK
ncbi:TPA: hypothetical protein DIU27_01065 [Candidatus Collierbacteria bacterium]|uniref:Uncharacterized protein n=1 Tax=Candidatus Collierbacteria bacterium GW2011_GWB2_44_22 TaxID=1618387 RepID=A0A0G1HX18_9BACT|nr:MAG: hypothetical protein UW31_C0010G0072 [Candidatus Collierbacteria bacterium GW2011_GWA2_44_13]KKT51641.1 MAG: hypothetical protein UW44_C0009G0005 [Candidatus Collierbacteria bacterium GW2011_GWB2_44_22]KKT62569.1 MAG: hypothetical protein UW56_C0005G0005 [Candidatus Collierbacteria bacterium GW2011_GWD1_44_27]KKT64553.1 MAG: hypothetical protein UW58_C0040G0005 [Candidatus Collierbacteria bacterium GW2011_GWC2_44_30]KKT68497.1 MAG: hypothetical protein UW64_C0017G0007 [Microgenomates gr